MVLMMQKGHFQAFEMNKISIWNTEGGSHSFLGKMYVVLAQIKEFLFCFVFLRRCIDASTWRWPEKENAH